MKVVNVRINGMENPVGFDFETVCVSWKVRETSARRQQNVKIEIALTEDFSELLWTKEGKNLNSAAEKLEFEQIETMIAGVEAELKMLTLEVNSAGSDFVKLGELTAQQQDAEQRLEQLVERWAYLTELAEASGVF